MENHTFMIKLRGTVYANELYRYPSIAGKHIYNLDEAIERAKQLFPDCIWEVYNGNESYCNTDTEQ
jgi:hypothetical protein